MTQLLLKKVALISQHFTLWTDYDITTLFKQVQPLILHRSHLECDSVKFGMVGPMLQTNMLLLPAGWQYWCTSTKLYSITCNMAVVIKFTTVGTSGLAQLQHKYSQNVNHVSDITFHP